MYSWPYATSVVGFNVWPAVWTGVTGPLTQNPMAMIETPECQKLGVGPWLTFRRWANQVGYLPTDVRGVPPYVWAQGPDQAWGLSSDTTQLDEFDRTRYPAAASEIVREFDVQRCIGVTPDQIIPTGVAFEVVRFDAIPGGSVGVVERLPVTWENVEALDDAGVPIFTFTGLNGEEPCRQVLTHPTPGAGSLRWEWRVTFTAVPTIGAAVTPYLGPIVPTAIPGQSIFPAVPDARNGTRGRWGDDRQYITPPLVAVRYWLVLFGPTNRFDVRVGARLGGYVHQGGRHGAALGSAIRRLS